MRVILFLLKCAVGFLASVGLIAVLLAVGLGVAWDRIRSIGPSAPEVPARAVLSVDLTRGLADAPPTTPIAALAGEPPLVLRDVVDSLHTAADDPQVKALAVRASRGGLSIAQAQALRDAVRAFRESGKPAHIFATSFGTGAAGTAQAYLASAFGTVWLQPSGTYALGGFNAQAPFLKGMLDKLGIEPRVDQRKAYKGFADRFTAQSMPKPQRENLGAMVDGLMAQVTRGIAQGREVDAGRVRELSRRAPLSAETAKQAGLVDKLGYFGEIRRTLRGIAGDGAKPMPVMAYGAARPDGGSDAPHVAVIDAHGAVTPGKGEKSPLTRNRVVGADTVTTAISHALDAKRVKAIVMRVSSPGGSYVASDTIWHAVRRASKAKVPLVVSMGDIAASGGYFIAAPADHIAAQPGTITGSIGVAGGKFVLTGLWDKLGITFDGVRSGPRADYWSPNSNFSKQEWKHFQKSLDETYADFTNKVARGRGLSDAEVAKVAKGRVFTGKRAKELGLVDSLGGFRHAVGVAKRLAGMSGDTRVTLEPFPEREDPLRRFLEQALSGRISSPAARTLARAAETLRPVLDVVELLDTRGRLHAGPRVRAVATPDDR